MAAANSPIFPQIIAIALVVCGRIAARTRHKPTAVPTLAPMLREVTPAVVNIAVRARCASREPAAQRSVLPAVLRRAETRGSAARDSAPAPA